MDLPLIMLGGGGHARVLVDALRRRGANLLGFTDSDPQAPLSAVLPWLGQDEAVTRHAADAVRLINGLGSVADTRLRLALFQCWSAAGYRFRPVVHPDAVLPVDMTELPEGVQVLAGAVIAPGVTLGVNALINTRAVVEHDCRIGQHVHVATGAVLCGGCDIGEGAHIGAGAVIIQGTKVGFGAVIAAGAVITRNVEPLTLVAGVPGKVKRILHEHELEKYRRP